MIFNQGNGDDNFHQAEDDDEFILTNVKNQRKKFCGSSHDEDEQHDEQNPLQKSGAAEKFQESKEGDELG